MKRATLFILTVLAAPSESFAQQASSILVDRVGDTGFVQLTAESFNALDARQQELAYWLTQAAIAIDPIVYDQLSRFGLRQKRLLEGLLAHPQGIEPGMLGKLTAYAKLFWANRGNHNLTTSQKFVPGFTDDELREAALNAQKNGAFRTPCADLPALSTREGLEQELTLLRRAFFDPDFEPMITAKSPQGGKDIVEASSNTFYEGVTLADLQGFRDRYPVNSRIVRTADGTLREEVYRAGTPDGKVTPGLYATYLARANGYLERARAVADPRQAAVIAALIRFYQTGESADWLSFGAAWVQDDATVDFANGFLEVYRDARGMKGSAQSFVSITDRAVTDLMVKLAQNAAYFEERASWDVKYKKQAFAPPVVKAVETVIETGDFEVGVIGDNLPNDNEIHEKYGTKNFLFTAASRALTEATGGRTIEEFAATPEIAGRAKKVGPRADELHTAMHEVIGHGSGRLNERLEGGAEPYLKEYFSTLEEARADLVALWNAWDPKLKELGLVDDQEEEARAMYDDAGVAALVQLRRIPRGDTIEEDHQRARALIANYLMDRTGAVAMFTRGGKTYVQVKDYQKMREGVGALLAELMRIKGEGDYDAIKRLVETYAVHFDPGLRDQVIERFDRLGLPTYWAGINPRLTAAIDREDRVTRVTIDHPRNAVLQYLAYGAMYDPSVASAGWSAQPR